MDHQKQPDRRTFLKGSTAAVVGGSIASLASSTPVHAGVDETLKVGLIGCGGRGTGAAINAMNANPNNKLTALCDIFPDRMKQCSKALGKKLGPQYQVKDDAMFSDFDGYQKLLDTDIDVVLLCTTPYFRPTQLAAAIEKGKHVFCEKPVAVDGPGIRSVLETTEKAKKKGLSIVSGLCWRYHLGVLATVDKILSGAIGDIVSMQENYLTGTLWHRGKKDTWSDMEYQIRNWLYFTWLSGDHTVEQHIHSLDKALWLMGDKPPVKAYGLGGRQVRKEDKWGNVYDHHATVYEWENGVKCHSYTRQQSGCFTDVNDYIYGTKGKAEILSYKVEPNAGPAWNYDGKSPSMYDYEHVKLFDGIRSGKPINNGEYMSYSTMMAIMGREACYSGETIYYDRMLNSDIKLGPDKLEWGKVEAKPVAMPGQTKSIQMSADDWKKFQDKKA